jgi:hypothetical protein
LYKTSQQLKRPKIALQTQFFFNFADVENVQHLNKQRAHDPSLSVQVVFSVEEICKGAASIQPAVEIRNNYKYQSGCSNYK